MRVSRPLVLAALVVLTGLVCWRIGRLSGPTDDGSAVATLHAETPLVFPLPQGPLDDMKPVRQFGHPNFFYTEIGSGPKGETVVYVLNKKTKKKRPDALIAQFKSMNK